MHLLITETVLSCVQYMYGKLVVIAVLILYTHAKRGDRNTVSDLDPFYMDKSGLNPD